MANNQVMLITGTSKGIGKYLVEYYVDKGFEVIGCSRSATNYKLNHYTHFSLDITDEHKVKQLFRHIRKTHNRLDILINNAAIASMNHFLLTPLNSLESILKTNITGTFLFCREAAKLMKKNHFGRIVNFSTVAVALKLQGEATYVASKAAIQNLTEVLAKEVAGYGITANIIGPTLTKTDLIRNVPQVTLENLLEQQALKRFGEFQDISNVIDFFISEKSDFITGQTVYLGGIN